MKKILLISLFFVSAHSFASCYGVLYVPSNYAFITKPVEINCDESKDDQAQELFTSLNTWIKSLGAPELGSTDFFMSEYSRTESLDDANNAVQDFAKSAAEENLQTVYAPITL